MRASASASGHMALVTGASRGIGLAVARRLQAAGHKVLMPSREDLDLESDASMENYLASIDPSIDILVNDAGINRIADLGSITSEDAHATLQINLLAPLRLMRAVAPGMTAKGFGRIVNISSIWSFVGKAGRGSYAASKSALNGLTRVLAVELAPHGILVNAVAPGYVMTDLTRRNNSEADLDAIRRAIPLQRLAEPDEIAHVVAFLCSEQNSYITGQVVLADGGYTAV